LGPLSVVQATMVSSTIPRSSSALQELADVAVMFHHAIGVFVPTMPLRPRIDSRTCVNRCMLVVFIHVQNGFFALACRPMKSIAAAVVLSSMVSILLLVSGPVSSTSPSADALLTSRGL